MDFILIVEDDVSLAEALDYWISTENREQGLLQDNVQLCGMEPFILDHMKVVERLREAE